MRHRTPIHVTYGGEGQTVYTILRDRHNTLRGVNVIFDELYNIFVPIQSIIKRGMRAKPD